METVDRPDGTIKVEVAYARPERQALVPLTLPVGASVEDAIRRSGILAQFPEIDLARNKVGIFGRLCRLDRALRDGERVEIHRPLVADPREVRRRLAAEGRSMGRKG